MTRRTFELAATALTMLFFFAVGSTTCYLKQRDSHREQRIEACQDIANSASEFKWCMKEGLHDD
jgi:hypothetical protein